MEFTQGRIRRCLALESRSKKTANFKGETMVGKGRVKEYWIMELDEEEGKCKDVTEGDLMISGSN